MSRARIRILTDQLANQIAAGEVIERPVAVVKELVENSLDAGATQVEVEFRSGGKVFMRIEDNGQGMSADEALLALERHATSKMSRIEDLNQITSFGFRGEALPSIASVSRFLLQTRRPEDAEGTEVLVNAGKLIHRKACGMPAGTRIEVSQLFNSVPARRKFLKADNTEAAHIVQLVRLLAVAHSTVAFRLVEDGRLLFRSPACLDLRDRIGEIWNRELARGLVPVAREGQGLKLHGLIGQPTVVHRSTRQELVTLVNRRPVDSRTLSFAVIEAYHGFVPKGRYPVAFLFLEIDPAAVDVNVHPAKREVRFREEGQVRNFVITALIETLRQTSRQGNALGKDAAKPAEAKQAGNSGVESTPAKTKVPDQLPEPIQAKPALGASLLPNRPPRKPLPRPVLAVSPQAPPKEAGQPMMGSAGHSSSEQQSSPWRLIGRFDERYGLFQTPDGLVLLEERAALERILYERVQQSLDGRTAPVQRLLFPAQLELEPLNALVFADMVPLLEQAGFEIEPFGRNFYRVHAVPDWIEAEEAEAFLRDLAGLVRERGREAAQPRLARESIARLAVTRRKTDAASPEDLRKLAETLLACDNPLTDLQGRPTYVQFDRGELRRRFGR